MKTKLHHLITILCFLLCLPAMGQEDQELQELIDSIEVIEVSPEDPLYQALFETELDAESGEVCEVTADTLDPEVNNNLKDLMVHIVKDTGGILVMPLGWKKEEWIKAGVIMAGISVISLADKDIKEFSQSVRTSGSDKVSWGLEKLGNGAPGFAALGATYATSLLIKDDKLKVTSLTAIESMAVAAVLTTLGKYAFHRTRPHHTEDPYSFSGPGLKGGVSFPSGHTGSIFSIATVFAESYKDKKLVPIVAYSVATLAGLSRVHDNKHWISDVVGGAVLGYAAGKFVSSRRLGSDSNERKVTVVPSFSLADKGSANISVTIPINQNKKK